MGTKENNATMMTKSKVYKNGQILKKSKTVNKVELDILLIRM